MRVVQRSGVYQGAWVESPRHLLGVGVPCMSFQVSPGLLGQG